MIHRRGAIPVLLLLVLVLAGAVLQTVRGPAAASRRPPTAQASTSAVPPPARARPVLRALATVERSFNAGDVRLLCRSGALVDAAVIRRQNARPGGCQSELEGLMAHERRLRLTVRRLALRRDLATVTVAPAHGAGVPVDLVRHGRRWLLSFSDGNDPMPALAGVT